MAAVRRPRNPFDDDDEDDGNDFVIVPRGSSKAPAAAPAPKKYDFREFGVEDEEDEFGGGSVSMQSQIDQRQQNMLQSTQRSLGIMYEAENMGNETAHELLRQGEQLRNVEKKVDKIDKDLDTSKKYVTSLKSVFGGVVNYFQGKKSETEKPEEQARAPSKLQSVVGGHSGAEPKERDGMEHPAMRLRDPYGRSYTGQYDTSGFQETPSSSVQGTTCSNTAQNQQFERQLDNNLDEMSGGLSRLKNLGLGLGDELDRQNDDIERITYKTGHMDTRIEGVNRDIRKILK